MFVQCRAQWGPSTTTTPNSSLFLYLLIQHWIFKALYKNYLVNPKTIDRSASLATLMDGAIYTETGELDLPMITKQIQIKRANSQFFTLSCKTCCLLHGHHHDLDKEEFQSNWVRVSRALQHIVWRAGTYYKYTFTHWQELWTSKQHSLGFQSI